MLDVVLGFIVKACFKGSLRVSEAEEAQGLDVAAHGESAYPAYVGLDCRFRRSAERRNGPTLRDPVSHRLAAFALSLTCEARSAAQHGDSAHHEAPR